jgi:hypothetical protein
VRVSVSSELGSPMSSPRAALRRASTLASLRAINFFRSDMSPSPGVHLKLSRISLANDLSYSFREFWKTFLVGRFFEGRLCPVCPFLSVLRLGGAPRS